MCTHNTLLSSYKLKRPSFPIPALFSTPFFFPFPCKGQDWISQSKYALNHPFTSNLEENA